MSIGPPFVIRLKVFLTISGDASRRVWSCHRVSFASPFKARDDAIE